MLGSVNLLIKAQKLLKCDLQGSILLGYYFSLICLVIKCKDVGLIGKEGIVIKETKNIVSLMTKDNKIISIYLVNNFRNRENDF